MIGFENYCKIKNNYCICYFGNSDEYLVMLELLRPKVENAFLGMNFFIGCRDESVSVLDNPDYKIMPISKLKILKDTFAHIKELKCDRDVHPVAEIMKNSGITDLEVPIRQTERTTRAVIYTHGSFPTGPLTAEQIQNARQLAKSRGFHDIDVNTSWRNCGLAIGVESVGLIKCAAFGIPTVLVPTGIGTPLVKTMFPQVEFSKL